VFFAALATDYDGTLAHQGEVDAATLESLAELKRSGRKLLLVTGRELPDLRQVFPELDLFDLIVAENGALLVDPASGEEMPLAEPPSPRFVASLRERGVSPISVGRTIVATWEPHETTVLQTIRDLGLELHIIFNKGAVMVLPSDVNKASGLKHALKRLRLSAHNVVGVGDAENDQAFLSACGCAVAVDNALDSVKAKSDLVVAHHGAGVSELARMMAASDLEAVRARVPRQRPVLGERADKTLLRLDPFESVLLAGQEASRPAVVTPLLEQMREHAYQFCLVDPAGAYAGLGDAVVVGDATQKPRLSEIMELLSLPHVSAVVGLGALDPEERPRCLAGLLSAIAKLRAETGRPHWLVIDQAHSCLPAMHGSAPVALPHGLPAIVAVSAQPDRVAPQLLERISTVVAAGGTVDGALVKFGGAGGAVVSGASSAGLRPGQLKVLKRDGTIDVVTAVRGAGSTRTKK
jgi:HAD superfamily hydrolase (TIGR01484 family)